jgi:hypothetical protein
MVEGTVAGAKVVQEQRDAEPLQAAQHVQSDAQVGDKAGLSHFQTELAAGDAELEK